jgi:3-hydroxyacyl-[acyl-carrier-protein] dehydratase
MIPSLSDEAAALFRLAERGPLLASRGESTLADREQIEALLPHRGSFLLLDRVTAIDEADAAIAARYDLARAGEVFAGHFPNHPIYPGVLHVEAIGQAGIYLALWRAKGGPIAQVALTHIAAARFIRPVSPGGELEIMARILDEGLFLTVVGQCLQGGQICSVVALSGLT